ncbi:putative [Pyruvate dehydrogenase (acetyl-transferring)]-phosphatase [Lupinus albus]|uniref:Putative [Pyruvate dehydrogenase (Acetyl-transferring)]-phosphatase n=1 Tax=Lupinus albus TaxID=3870 RepID=A0A6A4NY25_LUPAL|nr:putative [Pyruvate dehydrogenase (acetyl-transferring)]-phosphatase [Lupinus albus]
MLFMYEVCSLSVSRSIGDVYLKDGRFNRAPIKQKFRLPQPMNKPILSASPTIISHHLQPNDSFLIFASDGLWELLSNERAVDIVHSNPHAFTILTALSLWIGAMQGSARRLVKAALHEAARRRELRPPENNNNNNVNKKVGPIFMMILLLLFYSKCSRSLTSCMGDSAKKLVKTVLQGKRKVQYTELHKIEKDARREFHDDISVIVLFLNPDRISKGPALNQPILSVRSALDH